MPGINPTKSLCLIPFYTQIVHHKYITLTFGVFFHSVVLLVTPLVALIPLSSFTVSRVSFGIIVIVGVGRGIISRTTVVPEPPSYGSWSSRCAWFYLHCHPTVQVSFVAVFVTVVTLPIKKILLMLSRAIALAVVK